jgi:thioredoxin 1
LLSISPPPVREDCAATRPQPAPSTRCATLSPHVSQHRRLAHDPLIARAVYSRAAHGEYAAQMVPPMVRLRAGCGPCQQIGPRFEAMAAEFPHVSFAKVDVDAAEDVAERCAVTAMPTFQFYRGGARVAEMCGAEEAKLRALLTKHAEQTPASDAMAAPATSAAGGKKRVREATATEEPEIAKLGHGGKRLKGEPQPEIDTATKPVKWKKIIAKELKTEGGAMGLKALRKAAVAEVRAHPSHGGRDKEALMQEFDRVLPTFKKFKQDGGRVSIAKGAEDDDE